MKRIQTSIAVGRATLAALALLPALNHTAIGAAINDGHGKEWRQLNETSGLTWDQVAAICPTDGSGPCLGTIAARNLDGWIWASDAEVLELFGYYVPEILASPTDSVAGPEYLTPAAQFQNSFGLTQWIKGCPTYQPCFDFRLTGGITASKNESGAPIAGDVIVDMGGFFPTASFGFQPVVPGSLMNRGVWLWRSTGLNTGTIHAYDDAGQSPSPAGGTAVNVLANDWVSGQRATPSNVSLAQLSPPLPGVTLYSDGTVVVAAGTPVGVYPLTYQICDLAHPASCDDAVATITVRSFPIVAVNDQGSVSFGAGGTPVANVLANDTIGGITATPATVNLSQVSSTSPGISLNPATGSVTVAPGTLHGTHTLTYMICEKANPANCAQATVTLRPYTIDAVNDSWRLSSKTGATSPSVLANDWFNGARATTAKVGITLLSPLPKGITFNAATGVFTIAPKTESGTYYLNYRIHELASPANTDQATVTLDLSGKSS